MPNSTWIAGFRDLRTDERSGRERERRRAGAGRSGAGAGEVLTPGSSGPYLVPGMITGFNTDVEYEGRVYHVQTEDKGKDNPTVESLVYCGGEIVTSRRSSYDDLSATGPAPEKEILRRMEAQHHSLIREIRNGKYDPEGPKPFGYKIISNRSFDDVVRDYLADNANVGRIRLELEDAPALVEGSRTEFALRVEVEETGQPMAGAQVTIKLISTTERPRTVFSGKTDGDGRLAAAFEIPEMPEAEGAILIQADAALCNAEVKRLIRKPEAAAEK